MPKSKFFKFLFFVAASILILLVSACTLFRDSGKNSSVLTGQDAKKFIKSIRVHQGNAESYYNLGCHFQERKKHKLALSEFYKALECDPNYIKAYNALGVSYDALGDFALAVDSYNSALKIDPNSDYILNNLGYSYLLQDRPELAIESFKKAVALNNDNGMYHNNLGLAYAKNGQFDAAFTEFKKSGDEAKAHYNIAKLYYQEGLYKEAKEHFAAANNYEPETQRAFKAAERLEEILSVEEKAPGKTSDTLSDTPSVEIIYNDDRISITPSEIQVESNAEEEKDPEKTDEYIASITVVDIMKYDSDGIYTIPADTLKKSENTETLGTVKDEQSLKLSVKKEDKRVATAALLQGKPIEHNQESVENAARENGLVIFNEAYASQMLKLQKNDLDKLPVPRINIEVKNGNGVNRMARRVGDYLRNSDFILMYLSNADHFNHKWSKIYYVSGYLSEAYQLAQKLPGLQTLEEVTLIKDGNAEISILIGSDLIPYDNQFKRG